MHICLCNEFLDADDECLDLKLIDEILQLGGNCNITNITGNSPLHLACEAGNGLVVKSMLQVSTTYPCLKNEKTGETPASLAITAMLSNEVNLIATVYNC